MKNNNNNNDYHNHGNDYQNEIISIVCRSIKPNYEKNYDNWLTLVES